MRLRKFALQDFRRRGNKIYKPSRRACGKRCDKLFRRTNLLVALHDQLRTVALVQRGENLAAPRVEHGSNQRVFIENSRLRSDGFESAYGDDGLGKYFTPRLHRSEADTQPGERAWTRCNCEYIHLLHLQPHLMEQKFQLPEKSARIRFI